MVTINILVVTITTIIIQLLPLQISSQTPTAAPNKQTQLKEYDLALEAIFRMGIRLQSLLDIDSLQPTANFLVSPVSATSLIAQMILGAEGKFRDDLYELLAPAPDQNSLYNLFTYNSLRENRNNTRNILPYARFHLQLSSLLRKLKKPGGQYILKHRNALFYDEHVVIRKQFAQLVQLLYGTDLHRLDFHGDSSNVINKWAYDNTNGLISNAFPSNPGPGTVSILMNSIYFLAEWETPFSNDLNIDGPFSITEQESVRVTYMRGVLENTLYNEAKDFTIISIPYKNRELQMYILLPKKDNPHKYNIKKFVQNLDVKDVYDSLTSGKPHEVIVKLPKFSLSSSISLLRPLQKYSQLQKELANTPNANVTNKDVLRSLVQDAQQFQNFSKPINTDIYLDGVAENVKFRLSDIRQQIVMTVNEKGTEAAAISVGVFDYMGGQKVVVLDRPFVFFIRHEETLLSMFWGTLSNPASH